MPALEKVKPRTMAMRARAATRARGLAGAVCAILLKVYSIIGTSMCLLRLHKSREVIATVSLLTLCLVGQNRLDAFFHLNDIEWRVTRRVYGGRYHLD